MYNGFVNQDLPYFSNLQVGIDDGYSFLFPSNTG